MYSRRRFLAISGGGVAGTLAGCLGSANGPSREPREPGEYPDPTSHVHGSDGRWSSFGFDAANTRWDPEGRAPRENIEERWRLEVGFPQAEPIARDGRVFVPRGDDLAVLDEEDGSELWSVPTHRHLTPLVFEKRVYHVGDDSNDDWALIAREVETGEELWRAEVEATTSPAIGDGRRLVVGSGETLFSLDPETGEAAWDRRLFGRINDHIAMADLSFPCVTTRAGMVYQLWDDGDGMLKHQLPASTRGPPTAGKDHIYVGAMDGRVYAIDRSGSGDDYRAWSADVSGHVEGAIAYDRDAVYVASAGDLTALSATNGTERWSQSIGESARTAPAMIGDTVYVGGDRLYAFDPDGGTGIGRFRIGGELFSEEFFGAVGPGPVASDGVLYTYAKTGEDDEYHLLALESA